MQMPRSLLALLPWRSRAPRAHFPSAGLRAVPADRQSGFVLLAVLFMVALILIGLVVAAPRVAKDIQRDKESELYHRGLQYSRAIRLFYRRTGNYPTDLSQLENTNNIRFLRKRYVDPITGQPFRIIHQGEAKTPLFGLFGQPLGIQPPGASAIGNPIGSPIGGSPNGFQTGTNPLTSSATNTTTSSTASAPTDATTNSGTGSTTTGTTQGSGTGTGLGSTDSTGSTTVIGRIIGVSSTSPKESIRVYKKQTHYNQWEFVYDPASEGILGGGQPGLNPGGTTNLTPGTNPGQGNGLQTNPQPTQPAPQSTPQTAPQ